MPLESKSLSKRLLLVSYSQSCNLSIDMENGEVTSLDEALELAEEGTIIKLSVYTCNVKITKPGIKIEPRDKDKPVYLLGNDGPVIKVDLKDKQYVVIKRILLAHSGINLVAKFKEVIQSGMGDISLFQKKPNVKCLEEFDINKEMNCIVMV